MNSYRKMLSKAGLLLLLAVPNSRAIAQTWILTSAPITNWSSVASCADGTWLVAVANDGSIYRSTNAGLAWQPTKASNANWTGVASSADGAKLVAVANGGGIYTWQTTPTPQLNLSLSDNGILLSWTVPSMAFGLRQAPDLTSGKWTPVPVTPTLNYGNLQYEVSVPRPQGTMFYQLVSQRAGLKSGGTA